MHATQIDTYIDWRCWLSGWLQLPVGFLDGIPSVCGNLAPSVSQCHTLVFACSEDSNADWVGAGDCCSGRLQPEDPRSPMALSSLNSSVEEVARIARVRPAVLDDVLKGETRVTGRWAHGAFEAVVKPMQEHVLSATYAGSGKAASMIDGRRKEAEARSHTVTYLRSEEH